MAERTSWSSLRERRMGEPEAEEAYDEVRWAHELGGAVRELRLGRGWSEERLAAEAGVGAADVVAFEAGDTMPTLGVLTRFARALDAELSIRVTPRHGVA